MVYYDRCYPCKSVRFVYRGPIVWALLCCANKPKVEFKVEFKVKFKVEVKVKFKVELKIKFKFEFKVKFKIKFKVKFKVQLKVKLRLSPRSSSRLSSRSSSRLNWDQVQVWVESKSLERVKVYKLTCPQCWQQQQQQQTTMLTTTPQRVIGNSTAYSCAKN